MAYLSERPLVVDVDYADRDWQEKTDAIVANHAQAVRKRNPGELVGEVLRWQRADSYACYMIVCEDPFTLAHLQESDAYMVEPALIRGLFLSEARAMVAREQSLRKLFSKEDA